MLIFNDTRVVYWAKGKQSLQWCNLGNLTNYSKFLIKMYNTISNSNSQSQCRPPWLWHQVTATFPPQFPRKKIRPNLAFKPFFQGWRLGFLNFQYVKNTGKWSYLIAENYGRAPSFSATCLHSFDLTPVCWKLVQYFFLKSVATVTFCGASVTCPLFNSMFSHPVTSSVFDSFHPLW